MLSAIRSRNLPYESEAKFIQDRIVAVERTTAELTHVFSEYTRKAASIRDKGDNISKAAILYADGESINKTLSEETANFATCMSTISDYGDARVQTINRKVVDELKEYELICKRAKDEVRSIYAVRDKEVTRKKTLERLRERNPRNRHLVVQAETEVVKASAEVARTILSLEEEITAFERQKILDLKSIFLDFIAVEMGYHAKAIEELSKAYNHVANINVDSDIEEFKQTLRLADDTPQHIPTPKKRLDFRQSQSQSMGSLSTLLFGSKPAENRPSRSSPGINTRHNIGIPKGKQERVLGVQKSKSEDDLDGIRKDFYYDSETASSDQQSIKSDNVSPFLAKHFAK